MRPRAILAVALVLLAACVTSTPGERDAERRARDDAAQDLARGRPRLAFIGSLPDDRSALDPATGRVKFSVGCCPTLDKRAYRDAYNEAVRGAGTNAAAALAAKSTSRAAVDEALAAGGAEIRLGGTGAVSPGGAFVVEVARGAGRDSAALLVTDSRTSRRDELRYLGSDRALVAFSADGTTLFVRDDRARASSTYDLPSALFLEVFPDAPRER